jgi:hypothetical protein
MREALRIQFPVDCSLEEAWDFLARVEEWPATWAGHLRSVVADPPGPLTPSTTAELRMRGGLRSRFRSHMVMQEFEPGVNWCWTGGSRFSPTIAFDHRFRRVDDHRTMLEFVVYTRGLGQFGAWVTGRVLRRALEPSIETLAARLRALHALPS